MKTILIKAQVPEGMSETQIFVACHHNKVAEPLNHEIIEPPTKEQINEVSYLCHDFDGARVCMKWVLNKLGL